MAAWRRYVAAYTNNQAFVAVKAKGGLAAWGDPTAGGSGAPTGTGYVAVYSTLYAFAALQRERTSSPAGGRLACWGDPLRGGSVCD